MAALANSHMHVAVGLVFNPRGDILIAQRPPGKYQSGLWEFPGGKVEAGETVYRALQRELLEEVSIQVISAEAWLQVEYAYSDRHVLLDTWRVTQFSGEPQGRESQLVRWTSIDSLDQYQFPAGNTEIIKKLHKHFI